MQPDCNSLTTTISKHLGGDYVYFLSVLKSLEGNLLFCRAEALEFIGGLWVFVLDLICFMSIKNNVVQAVRLDSKNTFDTSIIVNGRRGTLCAHTVGQWDTYADISITFTGGLALDHLHCHPKQRSVCLSCLHLLHTHTQSITSPSKRLKISAVLRQQPASKTGIKRAFSLSDVSLLISYFYLML